MLVFSCEFLADIKSVMTKETLQYIGEVHQSRYFSKKPDTIVESEAMLMQEHPQTQPQEHGDNFQTVNRLTSTDPKARELPWHAISAVEKPKNVTKPAGALPNSCQEGTRTVAGEVNENGR